MKRTVAFLAVALLVTGAGTVAQSQTAGRWTAEPLIQGVQEYDQEQYDQGQYGQGQFGQGQFDQGQFDQGTSPLAPTIRPYTPAQIRGAYGVSALPATVNGAGQIIAIVDAFHDPNVERDLRIFINCFFPPDARRTMNGIPALPPAPLPGERKRPCGADLPGQGHGQPTCTVAQGPHPCFQKVFPQGQPSASGCGSADPSTQCGSGDPSGLWALEMSLDVQWAHAIAPMADILLVEAVDNEDVHLLTAVRMAVDKGAKVVSMSWGGPEFEDETAWDRLYFKHHEDGVAFVASSGDKGHGVQWPAVSPYVISVGGTTLRLNLDSLGRFISVASEIAWSGSGGGISRFEREPDYQSDYPIPETGGKRGNPDVSYVADPNPGVFIYDSTHFFGIPGGLFTVGGTSVGAPQWAAILALADQLRAAQDMETLSTSHPNGRLVSPVYSVPGSVFRDIIAGTNGTCNVCRATHGYNFVTGLGSPLADELVLALSEQGTSSGDDADDF